MPQPTRSVTQGLPSKGADVNALRLDVGLPLSRRVQRRSACLSDGVQSLFQKCQIYDVCIVVGGRRFPAHLAVLACAGEKFRQRLHATLTVPGSDRHKTAQLPTEAVSKVSGNEGQQGNDASNGQENAAPATGLQEIQLPEISSPEAVHALLDCVYNFRVGYEIGSDKAARDVLWLARSFDLPELEQLAVSKLVKDLDTSNVVARMAICEEFGLEYLYAQILEQLTASELALSQVSSSAELREHPKVLQRVLVLTLANKYSTPPAAELPKSKASHKATTKPSSKATAKPTKKGGKAEGFSAKSVKDGKKTKK
eukprot:gb/GFBE01073579.1/.p1 GENE.gb/GFBE01073579.1/~~gb/GFBE01073579.1/.p1  ORF type:complete len:312 (+),score=71.29 gb/GFBE01073579.1/:1-936(+)